jgi:hypothetical protein
VAVVVSMQFFGSLKRTGHDSLKAKNCIHFLQTISRLFLEFLWD